MKFLKIFLMRTIWSKRANTDLYGNIGHIAKDCPQNAKIILKKILALGDSLKDFPYKFQKEPIYNDEKVRRAVIYSF